MFGSGFFNVVLGSVVLGYGMIGICQGQHFAFDNQIEIVVLGTAQDAGYPQVGCRGDCCQRAWEDATVKRFATSIAIVDHESNQRWLVECTPNFTEQFHLLEKIAPVKRDGLGLDGILLTHAHIGHYAGLMFLGREVVGAQGVPVFAMPRMQEFLTTSGPWRQLVTLGNIELHSIGNQQPVELSKRIAITPIVVPHRDEFSETVGFRIRGPNRSALFLPDIDKWDRWSQCLEEELAVVEIAFLDATFFDSSELPGRDMSEIPHPFVVETMKRLESADAMTKAKVHFLHLNHSNPLLDESSKASQLVKEAGFNIAHQGQRVGL